MDNRKDILMGWEETGKKENAFSKESDFESDNNAHLISAIDTAAALKELLAVSESPELQEELRTTPGSQIAALPKEKQSDLALAGISLLRKQMDNAEKDPDAAAATAEKMLYLADSAYFRWAAVEKLIVVASKKKLTKVVKATGTRSLEGFCGQLRGEVDGVRSRASALPEIGSRGKRTAMLVLAVLMVAAAAMVLLNPTVSGWFTDESVKDFAVAVCAILVIAAFFLAGLWGSVAVLVVMALLMAGAEAIMPLALFGKLLVLLVLAIVAILALRSFLKESSKLTAAVRARRASQIAALRTEEKQIRAYGEKLLEQMDAYLKEDEAEQDSRSDELREHHEDIREYAKQHRSMLKDELNRLNGVVPAE
ncbi:MAG: hypothetical protein E7469_01605 [Ruminococcaceae bacterium]|nr:hypothetical protein [Oscillospiraceae bacterium]